MANTTTNKTATTKTSETKELKKQIAEQQKQIEALMEMIMAQQSSVGNVASDTESKKDVDLDEEVLVVSLVPNKLNLLGRDGSVLFTFDRMYDEQYIDYASLKEIVTANRQMAKNGRFYILDERVVSKLRLKNDYKTIVSPDDLRAMLNENVGSAVELYKMAPKGQKSVIIDMVKQKKFNNNNIDYNLLKELGELSGVDLVNIEDATKIEVK